MSTDGLLIPTPAGACLPTCRHFGVHRTCVHYCAPFLSLISRVRVYLTAETSSFTSGRRKRPLGDESLDFVRHLSMQLQYAMLLVEIGVDGRLHD